MNLLPGDQSHHHVAGSKLFGSFAARQWAYETVREHAQYFCCSCMGSESAWQHTIIWGQSLGFRVTERTAAYPILPIMHVLAAICRTARKRSSGGFTHARRMHSHEPGLRGLPHGRHMAGACSHMKCRACLKVTHNRAISTL